MNLSRPASSSSPGRGASRPRRSYRDRGSIYIAVLGVSVITITLAVGGILATRARARSATTGNDLADARLIVQSGLELARLWIMSDPDWRTSRGAGVWSSELAFNNGATVSISAADPADGSVSNRPHDPVVITAVGRKGRARHAMSVTLEARPVAPSTLGYVLHVPGELRVRSGRRVRAGSGVLSTNGNLQNEGVIEGTVHAASQSHSGIVFGGITNGVADRPLPSAASIATLYSGLGTPIHVGSSIDKQVLGPGENPWGSTNADGVYVINSNGDVTIKNARIVGTLIVIAPGRKVTLEKEVMMEPARPDYPTLVVIGDLHIQSTNGVLSESSTGVNFNPAGAPYNGVSDGDRFDFYPSEVRGLIHVSGSVKIDSDFVLRGALIAGSTATADAVDISGNPQLIFDENLKLAVPQGYAETVEMKPIPGSTTQVVD